MCTTFLTSWVDKDPRRAFLSCLFPWPYLLNCWQLYSFCLYQSYWLPLIDWSAPWSPLFMTIALNYVFSILCFRKDKSLQIELQSSPSLWRVMLWAEPLYRCTRARGWGSPFPRVRLTFYKWSWGKVVATLGLLLVSIEFQPYEWAGRRGRKSYNQDLSILDLLCLGQSFHLTNGGRVDKGVLSAMPTSTPWVWEWGWRGAGVIRPSGNLLLKERYHGPR